MITLAREAAGLTQQALADAAGLKLGGVRDLEQGRREPTWGTLIALADVLAGGNLNAFTVPPADAPPPKRGRPKKPDAEEAPKRRKKK